VLRWILTAEDSKEDAVSFALTGLFSMCLDRCAEKNRAMWSIESLSGVGEKSSQGCVRARFDLSSPMTGPYVSAVQFSCDGMTFSGIDFELVGSGYRISRIKKRFVSGKKINSILSLSARVTGYHV